MSFCKGDFGNEGEGKMNWAFIALWGTVTVIFTIIIVLARKEAEKINKGGKNMTWAKKIRKMKGKR